MTSFLRLVEDLLREPTERAAYVADPAGYLPARGFDAFDAADVELSLQLSADTFPPAVAELIDPTAGLDTVVAVDLDALPGLWNDMGDGAVDFEALGDHDDPFLDDEFHIDASENTGSADSAEHLDPTTETVPEFDAESVSLTSDGAEATSADTIGASFDADVPLDLEAGFEPEPSTDSLDEPDFSTLDAFDGPIPDIDDQPFD